MTVASLISQNLSFNLSDFTMYVEDLLLAIQARNPSVFDGLINEWYVGFIASVSRHVRAGKQLSTSQGTTILKLIVQVRRPLVRHGMATDDDIDNMLHQPEYRRPLYESTHIPREVRYLGDNCLGFRFKQNDLIVETIKALGHDSLPRPRFQWEQRIWVVPVWRHNLQKIMTLVNEYQFNLDAETTAYLRLARQSIDQPSTFVLAEEHGVILANVCDDPLLAAWIETDGIML